MRVLSALLLVVFAAGAAPVAPADGKAKAGAVAATKPPYQNDFTQPLGKEWFWGLGTWTSKDGVLRGFESGTRRHGPVKMINVEARDIEVSFSFRTIGKATWASIIFNQEGGHLCNVLFNTDKNQIRALVHPRGDEKTKPVELLAETRTIARESWHSATVKLSGAKLAITLDGQTLNAEHPALEAIKTNFGLGGDSGGPEGEKAGALEFKELRVK
jgi:hypothetical protein